MEFLAFLFFVAFAVFLVRAIQRITRLEEQFRLLHREVKKLAAMLPTASSQKANLLHEISSASADGTQDQEHVIRARVPAELPPPVYSSGAYSPTVPDEVDETRTAAESADTHVLSDTPAEKSAGNDSVEPSTTAASMAEPSPKLANEKHKNGSAQVKKAEKKLSFEEVLGGKWLAIIGAIAVIIGTGFFFKYAIDQGWVGPLERVLIGVVSGMVTYALGWYAVKKQYLAVGESLVGAAMGMLYFSLFAAHRMYDLLNQDATFAAMALVTTAGFGFAAYFNRQVTAKLGLFGGFVTPFLLAQQLSQGLLFGYLLVLDAGVLFLASYRKWPRVQISSLLATALVWQYWLVARYQPSQLVTTAILMTQFFVLYGLMAVWHNLLKRTPTNKTDIVQIGLVPFLYFAGLYEVTRADYWWLQSSIAIGLAFIYYLVTIYARSVIPNDKGFLFAHAGVAVLFTVIAVPLQWTGHWVTICWAVLSLVFVESAIRIRSRGLLEIGIGLMIVVLLMLLGYGLASIDDPTRFAEHLEQGRYDVPVRFGWSARAVTIPATPAKPLGVLGHCDQRPIAQLSGHHGGVERDGVADSSRGQVGGIIIDADSQCLVGCVHAGGRALHALPRNILVRSVCWLVNRHASIRHDDLGERACDHSVLFEWPSCDWLAELGFQSVLRAWFADTDGCCRVDAGLDHLDGLDLLRACRLAGLRKRCLADLWCQPARTWFRRGPVVVHRMCLARPRGNTRQQASSQ